MNKTIVLVLTFLLTVTAAKAVDLDNLIAADTNKSSSSAFLDKDKIYYPNATVTSALNKYKAGNYTGCLQELFSVTKKDPSNGLAYYYMAMAYTHLDLQNEAVEAYEKVISLNPNKYLAAYATKGRDCITGGPACMSADAALEGSEEDLPQDDLDKFISEPYGSGMSSETDNAVKQKELTNIKETINKKENLEVEDLQRIKDFDSKNNNNQSYEDDETVKIAQVSDEEILQAVKTLKDAGLTLNVQSAENPYAQFSQYQDPRMAEMSMLLGNNNNNNSNNMMNMLPILMSQTKKGENIDPRFMQAMMMNSMMSDLNYNSNNDYRY